MTARRWKSALGWLGLFMRRVVGFGGRVCGGKPSTNEKPRTFGEWMAPNSSIREKFVDGFGVDVCFGVGELVRAAGCGFRRAGGGLGSTLCAVGCGWSPG